jgi:hypothetical protein
MSRMPGEPGAVGETALAAAEELGIPQTSPPRVRERYEEYSVDASAHNPTSLNEREDLPLKSWLWQKKVNPELSPWQALPVRAMLGSFSTRFRRPI